MTDRLRAPGEDGSLLAVPPLQEAHTLLQSNRAHLDTCTLSLLGMPLNAVREEARRHALAAADHYHWEQGEPLPERADPAGPLLVSGHQPELFHPGVWAKNFALASLARRSAGHALNLIVDSDTLKSTTLRVPLVTGPLRSLPFDHWTGETPWEDRRVLAPRTFAEFGPAVLACLAPWGYRPLLEELWPGLERDVLGERRPLGEAFVRARRSLERSWGVTNREVPLSRLWSLRPFARLAGALLADLPRFHAVHNAAVAAYRQAHGIHSRNHPVPDLEIRNGHHEAPFWAYPRGQRRQRLFVRLDGCSLSLQLGEVAGPTLPHPNTGEGFLRAWCRLSGQGLCLRSRALITTLAARLLLSDLFLHGLGGGLYDTLTDTLFRDYLGIEPPGFLILTATRLLPLPGPPERAALEQQRRRVRDLCYNPQRYRNDPAAADLQTERRFWVEQRPTTRAGRRERFTQIRRLNLALGQGLQTERANAEAELQRLEREQQAAAARRRRDFSLVLFPESSLRPFFAEQFS